MVCKEDVLTWFKELESYKRIDAMCSLLNMCLPFELRFIGTYVEELGKRDFQELRGAELRANNPAELAQDVAAASDPRTPRKMALYVSLLRSCNSACAATLYAVLVGLENAGLLEELLLLYSMALHHPAFTFDQRAHFGDILERLEAEETHFRAQQRAQVGRRPPSPHSRPQSQTQPQPPPQHHHQQPALDVYKYKDDSGGYYSPPPPQPQPYETDKSKESRRPRYPETGGPPGGGCLVGAPHVPLPQSAPPGPPMLYVKPPRPQGPPVTSDQMNEVVNPVIGTNAPSSNEPLMPLMPEGVLQPTTYSTLQYNMVDFTVPHGHWSEMMLPEVLPPEMYNFSTPRSPLISQPTSPCDSRPVSPNVQVPPPPLPTRTRVTPRVRHDILPPPPHDHHQHQIHQLIANFNDAKLLDDERLQELGMPPSTAQPRSIEKLNGILRPPHSNKPPSTYCTTQSRHHQSSGSESGSSTGSHSPPDTPALTSIGPGRPRQQSSPTMYYMQHYPRAMFHQFTAYRPNFSSFTTNGEAPSMYGPQYSAPYVPLPMYTPPKVSCWNCGSMGHVGNDCKEPSIEEVTRAGGYQLDYSTAPPDINDK